MMPKAIIVMESEDLSSNDLVLRAISTHWPEMIPTREDIRYRVLSGDKFAVIEKEQYREELYLEEYSPGDLRTGRREQSMWSVDSNGNCTTGARTKSNGA